MALIDIISEKKPLKKTVIPIETIFFQITKSCNLKCIYCYSYQASPNDKLAAQTVVDVLSTLASRGSSVVIFSGGEPTLDANLPEYLHLAVHEYGHKVGIATNGAYLPDKLLKAIIDCSAFVQFSLDTLDKNTYFDLCGVDMMDEVLKNIDRVLNSGMDPTLSFTVTQKNFKDLNQIVEFALLKGITHLHIGKLVSSGRASCYRELGGISLSKLWDILYPVQLKFYESIGIDLVEEFILPFATDITRDVYCQPMDGKGLEITASGDVCACGMIPDKSFTYGNLNISSFEDILKGMESRCSAKVFNASSLKSCRSCEARCICGGGCRALSFIHSGSINGEFPYCRETRAIMAEIKKDINNGRLAGYVAFLKDLPSEKAESSRYF